MSSNTRKDIIGWTAVGLGTLSSTSIPLINYVFKEFLHRPAPIPSEADGHVVLAASSLLLAILMILVGTFILKKMSKAEALAFGYFYNFLGETVVFLRKSPRVLINDKPIDIDGNALRYEDVSLMIIIPDDLYGYYFLADVIGNQPEFSGNTQVRADSPEVKQRAKFWKSIMVQQGNRSKLVLLECPPTTLRSARIYRENHMQLNPYTHRSQLGKEEQQKFDQVCKRCRTESKDFVRSLCSIIKSESTQKEAPDFENKIHLVFLKDLLDERILKDDSFKLLKALSHNQNESYAAAMNQARQVIQPHMPEIIHRISKIAFEGQVKKKNRWQRILAGIKRFVKLS